MEAMRMELYSMSNSVAQQLQDQKTFSENREGWLENRMNQLERRCEKAERASDRLNNNVQNWDFDEMIQNQRKLLVLSSKQSTQVQNKISNVVPTKSRASEESRTKSPTGTPDGTS